MSYVVDGHITASRSSMQTQSAGVILDTATHQDGVQLIDPIRTSCGLPRYRRVSWGHRHEGLALGGLAIALGLVLGLPTTSQVR